MVVLTLKHFGELLNKPSAEVQVFIAPLPKNAPALLKYQRILKQFL